MKKRPAVKLRPVATAVAEPLSASKFQWISDLMVWLRPVTPLLIVILCIWFWFLTYGTGKLFALESFGQYYDSLATSLLQGRLDVSDVAVSGEAFIRDGKYYGYFGPTPAIARIPLTALFPNLADRWSRFSVLLAALTHLALLLTVLKYFNMRPGSWLVQVLIAALMLGSTMLYMVSRSYVYHEAILWAAAGALWSWYAMLRFVDGGRTSWLVGACLLAAVSFFARVTVGAGAMMGLLFLFFVAPGQAKRNNRILIGCSLAAVTAIFVGMNLAKFGTILEVAPYKYFIQATPARLSRVQGTLIHPEVFPFQVREIFAGRGVRTRRSFPWLELAPYTPYQRWPAHYDYMESHAGIAIVETGLVLLAGFGLVFGIPAYNNRLPNLLITVAWCVPILTLSIVAAMSNRYLHDTYPLVFAGSIFGMRRLLEMAPGQRRTLVWVATAALLLLAIPLNLAVTVVDQREGGWGVDEGVRADFRKFKGSVDRFLSGEPPQPIRWTPADPMPFKPDKGTVAIWDSGSGLQGRYEFDGRGWHPIAGADGQRVTLQVDLAGVPEGRYTLLSTGSAGACDVLMLDWRGDQSQFSLDHWTESVTWGDAFAASGDRKHTVVVMMDRLNSRVAVEWDGKQVYQRMITPHPFDPMLVMIGRSPAPNVHPPPFPGALVRQ